MPIGEFIAELILRPILEIVIGGLAYATGFLILKTVTLGGIRLAPFHTMQEKNRSKRKWYQMDTSIWLHRPMQGRALKADYTCVVGFLVWAVVGLGIYFRMR